MFPDSLKYEAAFASTYKRGQKLARDGHAGRWRSDYFNDSATCNVEGTVLGSEGDEYSVWVSLNMEREEVVDYDCTCPAQENYLGMCKHAVALALSYLDSDSGKASLRDARNQTAAKRREEEEADEREERELQMLLDELERVAAGRADAHGNVRRAGGSAKSTAKPVRRRAAPTSQALMQLMDVSAAMAQEEAERAIEAADGRVAQEPAEPADLLVTLARVDDPYGYRYYGGDEDSYELRLRVKRGKASYVVKRIDHLVTVWREERYYEYGKNLAFVHGRRAFTERSNELLEFVEVIERAQRAFSISGARSWYGYGSQGTASKRLALSSKDAIAVLDLMMGAEVTFETPASYGQKKSRTLKVVDGNPALSFDLSESEDGGWDLRVPKDAECIRCGDELYVVTGKKACRCDVDFTRRAGTMLEGLLPGGANPLHVSARDVPIFCERLLPAIEAAGGFVAPASLAEYVPPEAEFSFRIGSIDGNVTCNATVSYDEAVLGLFDDLREGQPVRDINAELTAQALVRSYFPNGYVSPPNYGSRTSSQPQSYAGVYGTGVARRQALGLGAGPGLPWFPDDDVEAFYDLYAFGLDALSELGEVFLSEKLRAVQVRQAPEVHVEATVNAGLLDLQVDASGMTPADLMRYLASYRRKQRYVRLDNGDIMQLGDGVRALSELVDGLGMADDELLGEDGTGGQAPANRTLFVDALLKGAPSVRFDRDEGFRSIVRAFDTVADSDFTEPDCLRDVLRGYQRTGFKWLSTLAALGFGGILADDMGLGKTVQVIALMLARKETLAAQGEGKATADGGAGLALATLAPTEALPSLVVCPASLVYNWISEIERFAPALDAVAVAGDARARKALIAQARDHDVLVTSYDLMKRDIEAYAKSSFDLVVLDEAHYIKNHNTKSAKSAKRLPARVRLALTGTPIENRLTELWSIFDFLMPGILGSAESFSRRFAKPIDAGEEGVAARLRKLVSPFILRRLKGEVLTDLPEKNESIVYAVMQGEQDKLYKANADKLALALSNQLPEEFARNKIAILAELTRLRQLCCDPHLIYENYTDESAKLETCMELVAQAMEGGHKILLFSQFTSMLEIIAERLRKERVSYLVLTGATSKEQRVQLVREFQDGPVPVFLISLKAGGVGLNLTAADIVIHFDPWWNLAAQNQATDRAHRIGQTRDVSVFKIIAKNTIEEKIVKMQESKRDLAESVIGGESMSSSTLTRDDVLALLDNALE